ncbi:ribonuclease Y [Rubellicoccus peritrichatus]|uniref:Ribonuclease Y n=1 Tax=Rubellicoccus peritrichatus TaxID=3080537 RepID=A0AAQ3LDC4_9BACT|nr:ribonuclease Y [Puniceicoccus sp. CR14]WOO42442.1 ribonuclease Y [Puniceicoccus sp. CR14]
MTFSWQTFVVFSLGALAALAAVRVLARRWIAGVRAEAKNILELAQKDAEISAREIKTNAQISFERERSEREKILDERSVNIQREEEELQNRRDKMEREAKQIESKKVRLDTEIREVQDQKVDYESLKNNYRDRLQRMGELTRDEARRELRDDVLRAANGELGEIRREILYETEEEARNEAQRILIDTMERMAMNPSNEISASVVELPNEEMKGRIIGREGRNIRSFESTTGVTLMIDETPGSILVSSFDPVRREVARIALERLVRDGRIHPVSIEETVEAVELEMRDNVIALGENALLRLRLTSVHPELVTVIGKMHYRLSNNQNTLEHSIEVAFLCSLLAAELGLDPDLAKRCGLFHDMGKAIDHEHEGSHAHAAAQMLKRYGEDEKVVNAVESSHDEVAPSSIYAGLLRVADALSAARPGARADSMDGYIQRIRSLEERALDFEGVVDAYAVQAGKEIRVIVSPEKMDDADARSIGRKLRQKIEDELQYPGTIKVTVIREQRFTEVAK